MKTIISKSPKETQKIAAGLAQSLKGGDILALVGDLGGGKTTFTQGLALGFGIKAKITSPTFVMLRPYPILPMLRSASRPPTFQSERRDNQLIHVDLYRLKNTDDTISIGLADYLGNKDSICVIEWADKIKTLLPKKTIWIEFEFINQNTRKISFKNIA